jgi:leader peptidase (prepilin peptidase)/N-methyltransferase
MHDPGRVPVDLPFALRWWEYAACLTAAVLSFALLPLPLSAFAAAFGVLAVWIAIVDLDRYVIPDAAVLVMLVLGLSLAAVEGSGARAPAVADAALRALAAGAALYLLRAGYFRLTGMHGLGLGDVKLAAAVAAWLAWPTLPFAVAVAAIGALVATGARAVVLRERVHMRQELPFGAFLAPAAWLSLLLERLWLMGS